MAQNSYKTVEIKQIVPVADLESLRVWLNQELGDWMGNGKRDGGMSKALAGSKAIDLIEEAGFTITPPRVNRGNTRGEI